MNEEDDMYIALLAVALLSVSGLGVYIWHQQWHVRLAREIRGLPEHVGERLRL